VNACVSKPKLCSKDFFKNTCTGEQQGMKLICKVLLDRIPVLALVHDCYLLPQENMYSFFLKKKITLKTI
jgi:hypothetical protein